MNLDRNPITSDQIKSKQNFDHILMKHKASNLPFWKSPWFWGPTGLASVGALLFLSLNSFNHQNNLNENTITLAQNTDLPEDTKCIHAPIPGENIKPSTFLVDPLKDEKIKLLSGTEIKIPKGSLQSVDFSKKVEIHVREFNTKSGIFIAGIQMDYGKEDAFETAGMIEIRATQKEKKVEINPDKAIEVSMQLTQNPRGFDFWYLNEEAKDWEKYPASYATEKRNGEVIKSNSTKQIELEIKSVKNEIKLLSTDLNNLKKPTESSFNIPEAGHQKFDLGFDKKDYPELAMFKDLIFEIIPTTGYDKKFASKTWSNAELLKTSDGGYQMKLSAKNTDLILPVRPVFKGNELKNAVKEFDLAIEKYTLTKDSLILVKNNLENQKRVLDKQLLEEIARIQDQNPGSSFASTKTTSSNTKQVQNELQDFQNVARFRVTRWGVFNSDKPVRYPIPFENEPYFTFEHSAVKMASVYVFDLDKNVRYSYGTFTQRALSNLGVFKNNDLVLVGIDVQGNIGSFEISKDKNTGRFEKINFERKESGQKTLDWLKKMLDENLDAA